MRKYAKEKNRYSNLHIGLVMRRTVQTIYSVFLAAGLFLASLSTCPEAKPRKEDVWKTRENLAMRLAAEWYKINVLSRELSSIADILSEMRDLQLYPQSVTGFDDALLVHFDKKIEHLEKRYAFLGQQVEAYKPPLIDALAILREMVVGEPVESMFDLLEKGDFKRINAMLATKHRIDSLWFDTDSLLNEIMVRSGILVEKESSPGVFGDDFFRTLRANLGLQSEQYYEKLNRIKNICAEKGSKETVQEMYRIEYHRIKQYVDQGKDELVRKKIENLSKRFGSKLATDDINMLLAKVQFKAYEYDKVLKTIERFPQTFQSNQLKVLYRIQSLYAIRDYQTIWQEFSSFDFDTFSGQKKNLLLWIIMESGLAIKEYDSISGLASRIDKNASYAIHVMHALARLYLQTGDYSTALSILESVLKFKTHNDDDKLALREIRIAIAELNYESENYDKAMQLFHAILKEQNNFDRALFGILWCYIKMNKYDKAETALQKLINQSPESPLAAEGILILAKRYLSTAAVEWKKTVYLREEEVRLRGLLERIAEKESGGLPRETASKYAFARRELTTLLSRLKQEKPSDYKTISSIYDKVDRICKLITTHYQTGSFQEVSFSQNRERLLYLLDSVMIEVRDQKGSGQVRRLSNARHNRIRVKEVVDKANSFSVIAMIDRFRWERDYIDWEKKLIRQKEQKLDSLMRGARDSSTVSSSRKEKELLRIRLDSLLIREENTRRAYILTITEKIESVLSTGNPDRADAAYFRYHLGELYYTQENEKYAKSYELYEKELSKYQATLLAYRNGTIIEHPKEPRNPELDHRESMKQYRMVIDSFQNSEFVAPAHYSLAWCYNDIAMFDSAVAHMETVTLLYPFSSHAPQAWMYCGEYNFDRGNLSAAIKCYQSVMRYPESEWFDEALYKLAWTQYRMSNPEKAISSFLALVDLGEGSRSGKALLEKESMDYIAISFSETDMTGEKGLERATLFARKLGDMERGCQILHRLASVYRDQGRYDMAKKTYRRLLQTYPAYSKNPNVESELIAVLGRETSPEEVNRMKVEFFKKYNHSSEWAKSQPDAHARKEADSTASKLLYDAAIGFHQVALQKNDSSIYSTALLAYRDFIMAYPASPLANECHYNLAEIQFSLGNYLDAAEEYMAVSKRYPDSKYKETAAWNAIVASQNLLKLEKTNQ